MKHLILAALMLLVGEGLVATVGNAAERPLVLPAAGDAATEALLRSPRHGEWVEVSMGKGAPALRAWVVYQERQDPAPVVLVIHEIFGISDWIRAVADALAAEGYLAVAPDLLSGKGSGGGGSEAFAGDAVRAEVQKLDSEEVVARLNAVRGYALKMPAASAKSAAIF